MELVQVESDHSFLLVPELVLLSIFGRLYSWFRFAGFPLLLLGKCPLPDYTPELALLLFREVFLFGNRRFRH